MNRKKSETVLSENRSEQERYLQRHTFYKGKIATLIRRQGMFQNVLEMGDCDFYAAPAETKAIEYQPAL